MSKENELMKLEQFAIENNLYCHCIKNGVPVPYKDMFIDSIQGSFHVPCNKEDKFSYPDLNRACKLKENVTEAINQFFNNLENTRFIDSLARMLKIKYKHHYPNVKFNADNVDEIYEKIKFEDVLDEFVSELKRCFIKEMNNE